MKEKVLIHSEAKAYSESLYEVLLQPVLEREEYQVEPIHSKLMALKKEMGDKDFSLYIDSLARITYRQDTLWLITRKEWHRSMIEGRFYKHICKAFNVQAFRIFTQ